MDVIVVIDRRLDASRIEGLPHAEALNEIRRLYQIAFEAEDEEAKEFWGDIGQQFGLFEDPSLSNPSGAG